MIGRALVLALVLTAATACGGAGPAPAPTAFDPPSGFGVPTGTLFGGPGSRLLGRDASTLPAAVVGTSIWATDGGRLLRVDSTGAETPLAVPPGRYVTGRPVPTRDGALVLVGASIVVPGSGTTPPGLAVELLAFDAVTGARAFAAAAPLPWTAAPPSVGLQVAGVGGGVGGGVAVLSARRDDQRTSVGIDLLGHRALWTADGVDTAAVLDDAPGAAVAVGIATPPGKSTAYVPSTVVGLDGLSGVRRFAGAPVREPDVAVAGPSTVAVAGRSSATTFTAPTTTLSFLDPRGATVRTVDVGRSYAVPTCVWDEQSVTVCSTPGRVFAVDAATAAPLWSLPDPAANRVAPQVTTAWHGAVYGITVNGPVILDGRTGADRATSPGAAPVLVDGYLGVATESSGVAGFGGGAAIHPAVR